MPSNHSSHFGAISEADFKPAWWAKNPHMQTIYARYGVKSPEVITAQERIATYDDDFIDLAWAMPNQELVQKPSQTPSPGLNNTSVKSSAKGLVVLFHGLEGSVQSHYIGHMMHSLQQQSYIVVLMHFRGCSNELNTQARAYHSGDTQDALNLSKMLKLRYPGLPLYAVGFSLGGNMLLKLLAENTQQSPFDAAVAISAPLMLEACAKRMQFGFSQLYQRHLIKSLQHNLRLKMQRMDLSTQLNLQPDEVSRLKTFVDFDEAATAPLHGFSGAQDYYQRCSALPMLHKITTPSLVLHAQDDPFMDASVIPVQAQLSAHVAYELSQHGGHVGFMGTPNGARQMWLPQRVSAFFNEMQGRGISAEHFNNEALDLELARC